jgi:hypothetical protein
MGPSGTAVAVDESLDLRTLLVRTQIIGHHFVVVPDALTRAAGVPEGVHPSNWIPQLDGRRRACGEALRLVKVAADLWCLKPAGHRGDHW